VKKRRIGAPSQVGEEVKRYLEKAGLAARVEEATVVPEWEERVGAAIAGRAVPLRVSRGTLFVAVRSSAWLMELRLMEGEILRRLNAGRAGGRIEKIRFTLAAE
jgi:predicted nucleic acid-binding Zn ribbon protein